ncbi:MAG: diaminopimelate epimerase [Pseudomonadota bacterium]
MSAAAGKQALRVWKMNGAGNAFAVFDGRAAPFAPAPAQVREIARLFGADQVIAIERDAEKDAFMRIWNADGGQVSACGNAARCIGQLLLDETGREAVRIRTDADTLVASAAEGGLVTVDMGSPMLGWEDIPLSEKMDVRGVDVKIGPLDAPYLARPAVVSIGNPHAVFFVHNVAAYDIPALGPLVEGHPVFPEGANVGFAEVLDRQTIRLRVWERGAGLTKACGTGACAALVCAARAGKTRRAARLILDGGDLLIHWRKSDDHVLMTGPVELEQTYDLEV